MMEKTKYKTPKNSDILPDAISDIIGNIYAKIEINCGDGAEFAYIAFSLIFGLISSITLSIVYMPVLKINIAIFIITFVILELYNVFTNTYKISVKFGEFISENLRLLLIILYIIITLYGSCTIIAIALATIYGILFMIYLIVTEYWLSAIVVLGIPSILLAFKYTLHKIALRRRRVK